MYDDISKDYNEQHKDPLPRRAPSWGRAVKTLLAEKSGTSEPAPVRWLAQKTGINEKNLHNIIAGRVRDPSSDKLVKISDALGVSFAELAAKAMAEDTGNFFVCGFPDRAFMEYPQHGFSIQCLSPKARGLRDFFWGKMTIRPFQELRKWKFRENSTVGIFLESGTLEIIYGNQRKELHANESATFDAGVPHKIKNIDSLEARLFLITSPALY